MAHILDKGMTHIAKRASALQKLVVEYVDTDLIKPNSYNPNRQSEKDFELLCRSMQEDGFTQPIVAQRSTKEIVDGEHRWRAARHLGLKTVPVAFVDMTLEQMRIATLRHNRARGSEDVDLSLNVLRDLRELGALDWAQDSLMIDDNELQKMLDDVPAPIALAADTYSEGWEPTKIRLEKDRGDGGSDSMSDEARERTAKLKEKMATASAVERPKLEAQLRKEVFRIHAVYKDSDGELIRKYLEPKPAQALLELCLKYEAIEG